MRTAFFILEKRSLSLQISGLSCGHGVLDVEKSLRETVDCLLTHFSFSFVTEEVDSMHSPICVKLEVWALKSWV